MLVETARSISSAHDSRSLYPMSVFISRGLVGLRCCNTWVRPNRTTEAPQAALALERGSKWSPQNLDALDESPIVSLIVYLQPGPKSQKWTWVISTKKRSIPVGYPRVLLPFIWETLHLERVRNRIFDSVFCINSYNFWVELPRRSTQVENPFNRLASNNHSVAADRSINLTSFYDNAIFQKW